MFQKVNLGDPIQDSSQPKIIQMDHNLRVDHDGGLIIQN